MADITAFETREALMAAAAARIAEALRLGIAARGAACAALSGGETPEPAYRMLTREALDWRAVVFALVDERFVAEDDPYSNAGMLRRALAPALSMGARLAPMWAPGLSPAEAAERADTTYSALHLDIAVLGMGADGHTASWFAGAQGLDEALDPASRRCVVAVSAPQAAGSSQRLTLTRAALRRAERLLMLITGAQKRSLLENATDEPVTALFKGVTPRPEVFWAL